MATITGGAPLLRAGGHPAHGYGHGGLRDRILSLADEAAGPLGGKPRVVFEGAVDATVPG